MLDGPGLTRGLFLYRRSCRGVALTVSLGSGEIQSKGMDRYEGGVVRNYQRSFNAKASKALSVPIPVATTMNCRPERVR
jgi:hypothetical protein